MGWCAFGIYAICFSFVEMDRLSSTLVALPFALAFSVGLLIRWRDSKRYEIDIVRWRIENLREAIDSFKRDLEEGKPFYDDTAHEEWDFDLKYQIRSAEEQLAELELELSNILSASTSAR